MHTKLAAELENPVLMRHAGRELLSLALIEARNRSLRLFEAFEAAGRIDVTGGLGESPRRWLGRLGWFQEHWIGRNLERQFGCEADPGAQRLASIEPQADDWYAPRASQRLASTLSLTLPDLPRIHQYLLDTLDMTLDLLHVGPELDSALYFYRMALFNEDMQIERLLALAQRIGVPVPSEMQSRLRSQARLPALEFAADSWDLGEPAEPDSGYSHALAVLARHGYRFDLETGHRQVKLQPHQIDAEPVCWQRYIEFIADGGYRNERWWSQAGWHWVQRRQIEAPRQTEWRGSTLLQQCYGHTMPVDPLAPVQLVNAYEAEAWCQWAGRRLPTEAEWEHAASSADPGSFRWGQVWEWTADRLHFYSGYRPGPLHGQLSGTLGLHRVLRGGSHATALRLKHPKYRHHLAPYDEAGFCGFRSCAA